MVLPDALAWVLNMVGIDWPNIDEDELRSTADSMRQIAEDLTSNSGDADSQVKQMLSNNSSESMELFEALWNKLSGSHVPQMAQGMKVAAGALDAGAVIVVGMKVAAIAQLAILAAEIISDQVEAAFTFGASEALIPVQTVATREIMKTIEKQIVDQLEQQLIGAVEGPVIDALTSAGTELAGQLLGDGTVDMSKVVSAGGSALADDAKDVASNPLSAVGLSGSGESSESA
jgi:hypothetical protein